MVKNQTYYFGISVIFVVFSLSFLAAAAISPDLHLNIQTTDGGGNVVTGTFDFQFNITTDAACSNVVYSNSTSLTTDSRGIISYYLENVNLNFDQQYYLCYYRNGDLIETSKIARTPYSFTAQNTTTSGLTVDSGLDFTGYNLTADYFIGDGRYLTNLNASSVNYWTQSGSNLYYNSGNVGIGTSSPNYKLEVNGTGRFNGNFYVDTDEGNDAFYVTRSGISTESLKIFVNDNLASFRSIQDEAGNGAFQFDAEENGSTYAYLFRTDSDNAPIDALTILGNGNVGIGTTAPGVKLDVAGIISSSSDILADGSVQATTYLRAPYVTPFTSGGNFDVRNYAGSTSYLSVNTTSGNVGVGVTNPSSKLDIGGGLRLSGDGSFASNVAQVYRSSTLGLTLTGYAGSTNDFSIAESGGQILFSNPQGTYDVNFPYTSTKVGIGNTAPNYTLDVTGDVNAYDLLINGSSISSTVSGQVNSTAWNSTGDKVFLSNTSASVGIGTTAPSTTLEINSSANTGLILGGSSGSYINFKSAGTSKGYFGYTPAGSTGLAFLNSSGNSNFLITDSGNVGIGTTSPGSKLEVFDGNLELDTTSTSSYLAFSRAGSTKGYIGTANYRLSLIDQSGSGISFDNSTGSSNVFITSAGKLGVGTTSPSTKLNLYENDTNTVPQLTIQQDGTGDAGLRLLAGGNAWSVGLDNSGGDAFMISNVNYGVDSSSEFTILQTGNIGIGTNNPSYKLDVAGDINGYRLLVNGTEVATTANVSGGGTTNYLSKWTGSSTLGSSVVYDDGSKVGIGTTAPTASLEVDVDSTGNALKLTRDTSTNGWMTINFPSTYTTFDSKSDYAWEIAGTEVMRIDATNNGVGIGTTSPDGKLNVKGGDVIIEI